jgi:uncharacterized membrane-anchored protein YitT (DUF2179 family)
MESKGFFSNFLGLYTVKSFVLMLFGVLCAVLALRGFMIPNGFLDGGVTGISLLIHEIWHISFSILILGLNLLFFIPAYKHIGKRFAIRSFIAVAILAIGVEFLMIEPVTTDKLLIAIFGGSLIGLGMGLVIRSGAAIDGFELLALFTTKRIGFSISEVILFLNSIIFLIAAIEFGLEAAMYSVITYFAALKVADYVVDGIEEYISVTILSKESDKIKSLIVNKFGKGISIYKGERGYLPGQFDVKEECDIIVTIVTRLELLEINNAINEIDDKAFVYTHKIKETKGGVLKQKAGH